MVALVHALRRLVTAARISTARLDPTAPALVYLESLGLGRVWLLLVLRFV